jgi:hypothetical protein
MNKLDELDQYLEPDYSPDYWSEIAIDRATELVDSLDDADWARLQKIWSNRPTAWQVRLADAVFLSDKPQSIDLLCQMLKSHEVQVALAAAESLEAQDDVWTPDPSLRNDLERLLEQLDGGERRTVEALIARILDK